MTQSQKSESQASAASGSTSRGPVEIATEVMDKLSSFAQQGSRIVLLGAGVFALLAAIASKLPITTLSMNPDEFFSMLLVAVIFLFGGAVIENAQRHRLI